MDNEKETDRVDLEFLHDWGPLMESAVIRRQYDNVISHQYDEDPQNTTGNCLERALGHLESAGMLSHALPAMRVLDVGMGTGIFLDKLRRQSDRVIEPWGIDISEKMASVAKRKLPDLICEIDDGANLGRHFCGDRFDLLATHFLTGFVPIGLLAPQIFEKLKCGGVWSFVGGTTEGYPELQRRAAHPLLRLLFRSGKPQLQGMICPRSEQEVVEVLKANGFEVVTSETFEPQLRFPDFAAFIEYGYHGGWLTPFIEEMGLHNARRWQQKILDRLVFPVADRHSVVLAVARRPE